MKYFIFLAAVLFLQTAHAWPYGHRYCNGPYFDTRQISSEKKTIKQCELSVPLSFIRVNKSYPRLGNLTVDAWEGAYTKQVQYKNTYRVDVYDCLGNLKRSYDSIDLADSTEEYSIENPNLRENVPDTFVANAPLTNQEASAALEFQHQKCLKD